MALYQKGAAEGGFEAGVRMALEGILASPRFVFRFEERPAAARAGEAYALSDVDLASRLSFFLWATGPDEELLRAGGRRTAVGAGDARAAGAADARRSAAPTCSPRASPRSGCGCRISTRSIPTSASIPTSTSS